MKLPSNYQQTTSELPANYQGSTKDKKIRIFPSNGFEVTDKKMNQKQIKDEQNNPITDGVARIPMGHKDITVIKVNCHGKK